MTLAVLFNHALPGPLYTIFIAKAVSCNVSVRFSVDTVCPLVSSLNDHKLQEQ